MSWRLFVRPRTILLFLLWTLPVAAFVVAGSVALYNSGWALWIVWTLPPMWLLAWLVGRAWKPPKLHQSADRQPLTAPTFWSPLDSAAIEVVEQFRQQVDDVDYRHVVDINRYLGDAQELAAKLAKHYHADDGDNLVHPLTLVEILTVIHLAAEDLERWVLQNVPGSDLATIGQLQRIPGYISRLDTAQKVIFIASAVFNPAKLFAYPLWRKSGRVAIELQNELIRTFYQRYLRQLGYYLIEMYSGRLQAGSESYREKFGPLAGAVHAAAGDRSLLEQLDDVPTTIAVIGQVKAGKSSLINALMEGQVASTSVLPETRRVSRYQYVLPESENSITLLDSPGYSEADISRQQSQEIQAAVNAADIVLLVMAANMPARDPDLQVIHRLLESYKTRQQLRPPAIIGVITHIDQLRPLREWSPPYNWRKPHSEKERSIAAAVEYVRGLFGKSVTDFACVYTGDKYRSDSRVAEELVPLLIENLDGGHAAAVLKAFYKQLARDRFRRLASQLAGLGKMFR